MRLHGRSVVVAGGTGNVGGFVVASLLDRGATVVVPSRSEEKLVELRSFLEGRGLDGSDRLVTLVGDLSDEAQATELRKQIEEEVAGIDGAVASLGEWRSAPSVLSASSADLEVVLQGYLLAHFRVARLLLPAFGESGSYVFINGPLAFDVWPDSGSAFVSIATAGQHMLFRALAQEFEGSGVQVNELVSHAFIRDRTTQPGSPLSGDDVGAFAAGLLSGASGLHGESVRLRSREQVEELQAEMSGI